MRNFLKSIQKKYYQTKMREPIMRRIHELNILSLKYPEFEVTNHPYRYKTIHTSSLDDTRYEIYCILWFNILSEIYDLWGEKGYTSILFAEEIVMQHSRFFKYEKNQWGYDKKFIQSILKFTENGL